MPSADDEEAADGAFRQFVKDVGLISHLLAHACDHKDSHEALEAVLDDVTAILEKNVVGMARSRSPEARARDRAYFKERGGAEKLALLAYQDWFSANASETPGPRAREGEASSCAPQTIEPDDRVDETAAPQQGESEAPRMSGDDVVDPRNDGYGRVVEPAVDPSKDRRVVDVEPDESMDDTAGPQQGEKQAQNNAGFSNNDGEGQGNEGEADAGANPDGNADGNDDDQTDANALNNGGDADAEADADGNDDDEQVDATSVNVDVNRVFLQRIRDKCNSPSDADIEARINLIVGRCDFCTSSIQNILNALAGGMSFEMLETKIVNFFSQTLKTHATVSICAKKKEHARIEGKYGGAANFDLSLSCTLHVVEVEDAVDPQSISDEDEELEAAAKRAQQDSEYTKSWTLLATLPTLVRCHMSSAGSTLVIIRVWYQVTLAEFIESLKGATVESQFKDAVKFFRTLFEELGLGDIDSFTLDIVFEKILSPYSRPGTAMEARLNSLTMTETITKRFGEGKWLEQWGIAESTSATKKFKDYSPDEIQALKPHKPYFTEKKVTKLTTGARARLKRTSRVMGYNVFAEVVAQSLGEDPTNLSFALFCAPPSYYVDSKVKQMEFLLNRSLVEECPDEEYMRSVKETVEKIYKKRDEALEDFSNATLFLDITADIQNRTLNTCETLSSNLQIFPVEEDEVEDA